MTAINAIVLSDSAVMVTDTALYNTTGRVVGFGSKVVALPHLRMALACRGPYPFVGIAASEIGADFETFDEFTQDAAEYLETLYHENFRVFDKGETEFDLVVIGWKERTNKPAAYVLSSIDHESGEKGLRGGSAFKLARRSMICAPSLQADVPSEITAHKGQGTDGAVAYLLSLLERQRLAKWPLGSGAETKGYIVGGAACATTVTVDGISQRILKRWPDEIDEMLEPENALDEVTE